MFNIEDHEVWANTSDCPGLDAGQLKALSILKGVLSLFSCLPCFLVIFIIVYFRSYRFFVYRLALYLTTAAILYSLTTALQMVPGDLFNIHNQQFCEVVGYLAEYGSWVLLLYIYWVIAHLLLLSVCHVSTKKAEKILVVFPSLLPLVFIWVPFINGLYGQAGGWCWIVTATDNCTDIKAGQIEQFVLWYGPMFLASIGSILVTLTTVIVLCRGACERTNSDLPQLQDQYRRALKETLPLLVYSILFSLFDWVAISSRVYFALTDQVNYPLWIVHAIGDACRGLFIPLAYLFHPRALKKLSCTRLGTEARKWFQRWNASMHDTTYFVVSKEHSDESQRLVVKGREEPNSTHDTGYQSFGNLLET